MSYLYEVGLSVKVISGFIFQNVNFEIIIRYLSEGFKEVVGQVSLKLVEMFGLEIEIWVLFVQIFVKIYEF